MEHHLTSYLSLTFHRVSRQYSRITNTSLSMLIDASKTVNLDPSTSCHYTPTSAVSTLSWLQRKKSSTSKAKRLMCMILNRSLAVCLLNSLKPHWVSLVFMPSRMVMIDLKTNDTNFLWNFLWTFPYYSSARLDPTTKAKVSFFCCSMSFIFSSNLVRSLNLVAPSASTMSTYCPFDTSTPARTAPPFPRFLGYSTTTVLMLNLLAVCRATSVVLSLEPSLTIIISYVYFFCFRNYAVSSSMTGKRASSLQLGTTRLRYTYGWVA